MRASTRTIGWLRNGSPLVLALLAAAAIGVPVRVRAEVCNIRVVTDANPDYTDAGSMIHSITANWPQPRDKCWAMWYWNHVARRQTAPMVLHGMELTDPVRQFNDYGYTMCSTVSGVNCAIWGAMGLKVKFWDISLHTVPEVEYDRRYHMYDNSLSALYTLCDGKTIAGVAHIGTEGAGAASGGKTEPGHVARYHCLNATSANGFLTGCDTIRSVAEEYGCFNPRGLKYRYYYNNWDLGHRYILNLRDNEVYARHYHRLDPAGAAKATPAGKSNAYACDPAYFVPNQGKDPEAVNPRYQIRGNGVRTWTPSLTPAALAHSAHMAAGVAAVAPAGVQPVQAGQPGQVVFKVEGANVITSMTIKGTFHRKGSGDLNAVSVSTTNGLRWQEVWKNDQTGQTPAAIKLRDEVTGAYEVLVKVELMGMTAAADAQVKTIAFETITMLNSKTQPSLRLGKNTVYVGAGEQTGSIVLWPDLQGDAYKAYVVEEHNVKTAREHPGYMGAMFAARAGEEAYVVFKIDAPTDITRVTYGGRLYNRAPHAHIDFLHSLDGGKTWTRSYSLADTTPPWDVIHYEKVQEIPAGVRSVLLKYLWNASSAGSDACSLYALRMEVNHRLADPGFKPMEVTFAWQERQEDYSLVGRSHTQLVEKAPLTYTINIGGADHSVVDSLTVSLRGARAAANTPVEVKYGYADGKDSGGQRFQDRWVTYGKNLAEGKPYTCTVPSETGWGGGDPDGKVLTDGIVGPPYVGGIAYRFGALWKERQKPVVTVDLGKVEKCGAFCIHTGGYPFWDALRGEVKDKVEVLTSTDGERYASQGFFDFNLRWKDIPANHAWPDEEAIRGHNYLLTPAQPVDARYVRFAITPARFLSVSEVQVLDSVRYEPFDLRIALPDGKDRSDITQYLPEHTPATLAPAKKATKKP